MPGYPVWFEREIHPDLVEEVPETFHVLGPGTVDDEWADAEKAVGIVASAFVYDAGAMDRLRMTKVIARTGIGYDQVDVASATERGIAVCNTPDAPTVSTAEHAIALLLAAAKRIPSSARRLVEGQADLYSAHRARELDGKTLGLVGFGRIARRVARAAEGLGMVAIAYDPFLPAEAFSVERVTDLDVLLGRSDAVSVHVPLTADTMSLFDAGRFAAMKPGAVFVNTARGGVADQEALLEALDSGHLFAAGIDVTEPEPLPAHHPLLHRDNVVVTPHVASGTEEGRRRIFVAALEQVEMAVSGHKPTNILNPEVWKP